MNILVTGGAGYIGSHTCVELLNAGYDIVVVDDLSNSSRDVIDKIKKITNKDFAFYENSLLNKEDIIKIFSNNKIDAVIHFAGFKAVGESVEKPLKYYSNNIISTIFLCEVMAQFQCKNLVFSSSATVYAPSDIMPLTEDAPLGAYNPYGRTKLMIEEILNDLYHSDLGWNITILRYFNPIGADKSGLIGEKPQGIPNNLMPYIVQVAKGSLEQLKVFGNDYNTPDGTGVRDYIHVVDLAKGHVRSIEKFTFSGGIHIYNLGTGTGYSVLDVIKNFEIATNQKINYKITERRPGDIALYYADPSKAKKELGWQAELDIRQMCLDSWNFAKQNN